MFRYEDSKRSLTETNVAGKNVIVTIAIVFIATPSSLVAMAISTFVLASSCDIRLEVCKYA
jgi:hypothetical protein